MKKQNGKDSQNLVELSLNDRHFDNFVSMLRTVDSEAFLDKFIINRPRTAETYRIDSYCMSVYENSEKFNSALKIAEELLDIHLEPVVIRSLFRICRKIKDYERADKLLDKYPEILKRKDFNTLYELVYYFESYEKLSEVEHILKKIEDNFPHSTPIQRTVRNFYLKFGLIKDADRVKKAVSNFHLQSPKESSENSAIIEQEYEDILEEAAVQESQDEMISKMLEHEKRLTAISDLAKGISHEFGQPITNIRYTIQNYQHFFKGEITKEILFNEIFSRILKETERMGRLNDRLSPITSSKSFVEEFDIIARIQENVNALNFRLQKSQIRVNVNPTTPVFLNSDPVKFDQLINNLLLNAIDSIEEKEHIGDRQIDVQVKDKKKDVRIIFTDTGKGIAQEHRGKIFDPFFSTKNPGKGEGLGLFIVWNILKMQDGKIVLDTKYYERGARFFISIPKK